MNSKGEDIKQDRIDRWADFTPSAEDYQHWSDVFLRAQAMMIEFLGGDKTSSDDSAFQKKFDYFQNITAQSSETAASGAANNFPFDPSQWFSNPPAQIWADQMQKMWQQGSEYWTSIATLQQHQLENFNAFSGAFLGKAAGQGGDADPLATDRRFAAEDWHQHPAFIFIRQSYGLISDQILQSVSQMENLDEASRSRLEFAAKSIIDAFSPTNLVMTNPEVLKQAVKTKGESLLKGLRHMLSDLQRGQLSHVDRSAFELGVNIATTPGKVVHETPLYQLIQYQPTNENLLSVPLLIFPPWINRFYILDLNPKKSFVKWALDQGLSVFMVSWKSADESMADVLWDDYIKAQIDAMDVVRDILDVPQVHCIGYCVAGTTLAATLAMLAAKGEADRVKSATFFTAQVDFELAGELKNFVDETTLALLEQLSGRGYLDGRYMAATFNLLRSQDLIWNYVIQNYLMGQDYPAFDLLYWNGDTTNLPAKWHKRYLIDLYQRNLLVQPDALEICGVPNDLSRIKTPCFVQAGREDHIAPLGSVWRIMDHLSGPKEFLIAGSGHIAGVVNPPSAQKYQYWTGDSQSDTVADFDKSATEHKGSWWPYWMEWLRSHDAELVPAKDARIPGEGKYKAIEDAPGRYVRQA